MLTFFIKTSLNITVLAHHIPIDELKNENRLCIIIPSNYLVPSTYLFDFLIHVPNIEYVDRLNSALEYKIEDSGTIHTAYKGSDLGNIILPIKVIFDEK